MTLFICGSPRKKEGLSYALLSAHRKNEPILTLPCQDAVPDFDAAVIAFPLYFDGLPSELLSFLDRLPEKKGQRIYAVCNCGFYEGKQTLTAFEILEDFCLCSGRRFCGGMGIGAGPLLSMFKRLPLRFRPHREALRDLDELFCAVRQGEIFGTRFYDPAIPRRLYMLCAHGSFRLRAKRLRL